MNMEKDKGKMLIDNERTIDHCSKWRKIDEISLLSLSQRIIISFNYSLVF